MTRHRPPLFAVCRRALGDPGLAEDAVQDACLQAFLGLDRLRDPSRFGSWLIGIGLNCCHRQRRTRWREVGSWDALLGGQVLPEPIDGSPGPVEEVEDSELRTWLDQTIATLPPGQQAAVRLYYLAGLTQAETAEVLGVTEGAVKTRLHHARHHLRRTLDPQMIQWPVEQEGGATVSYVTMQVSDVRRRRMPDTDEVRHMVVLREVDGARWMLIWIGIAEALAMTILLEQVPSPRPLTYALTAELVRASGGQVREVRIDRLDGNVFYATIALTSSSGEHTIDARPSDALTLAMTMEAPIRVTEDVLEALQAGDPPADLALLQDETEGRAAIMASIAA